MRAVSDNKCNQIMTDIDFKRFRFLVIATLAITLVLLLAGCSSPVSTPAGDRPSAEVEDDALMGPDHPPGPIVQVEEIIIGMLFIAAIVSLVSSRYRIPYTVGLVVVGFGLTFLGRIPMLNVTPELILALLVPPLVFEAAFQLNYTELRRDLRLILLLAVPGVILTTFLVGGVISLGTGIGLPVALVFGSLVAATDPVSVIALFRSIGAPKRLRVLLEGESLLNDGTAIVLFNLMLAVALTGQFDLGRGVMEFFIVAGGGVLVGLGLGLIIAQIIGRIDNYLVETSLTAVLAYGSYLLAEYVLGVSGVLAVVVAGLATGEIGPRGMSPTTRIVVFNFWEFVAFLTNSFIFLIIGLEIELNMLVENAAAIFWGILAVLVGRAVVIYGLALLKVNMPVQWRNILYWGGLRGAISLALALSLPAELPFRVELQAMAFGVVLFTLIVQGLTMRPLMKHSKVVQQSENELKYEQAQARAAAIRAARTRIQRLNHDGTLTDSNTRRLMHVFDQLGSQAADQMHEALEAEPRLRQDELVDAWLEGMRAQRGAITALFRDNIIGEETYTRLVSEIDFFLANPERDWPVLEDLLAQEPESQS